MPENHPDSPVCTSVPDTSAGARVASDYGADGLYLYGPQLAQPHWVRLIPDAVEAPTTLPPAVVRARQSAAKADKRRILARHAAFLAAIQRAA